jgi:hypothetical protein
MSRKETEYLVANICMKGMFAKKIRYYKDSRAFKSDLEWKQKIGYDTNEMFMLLALQDHYN